MARFNWTPDRMAAVVADLAVLRTEEVARRLNVRPKTLRSALRRAGISIRSVKQSIAKNRDYPTGVVARRPVIGPPAIYGAKALVALPDGGCHWPIGDPAEPGFRFCGAPTADHRPYCERHMRVAYEPPLSADLIAPARRVLHAFRQIRRAH